MPHSSHPGEHSHEVHEDNMHSHKDFSDRKKHHYVKCHEGCCKQMILDAHEHGDELYCSEQCKSLHRVISYYQDIVHTGGSKTIVGEMPRDLMEHLIDPTPGICTSEMDAELARDRWYWVYRHLQYFKMLLDQDLHTVGNAKANAIIDLHQVHDSLLDAGPVGRIVANGLIYDMDQEEHKNYFRAKLAENGANRMYSVKEGGLVFIKADCVDDLEIKFELQELCQANHDFTAELKHQILQQIPVHSRHKLEAHLAETVRLHDQAMSIEVASYFLTEQVMMEKWYYTDQNLRGKGCSAQGLDVLKDQLSRWRDHETELILNLLQKRDNSFQAVLPDILPDIPLDEIENLWSFIKYESQQVALKTVDEAQEVYFHDNSLMEVLHKCRKRSRTRISNQQLDVAEESIFWDRLIKLKLRERFGLMEECIIEEDQ